VKQHAWKIRYIKLMFNVN